MENKEQTTTIQVTEDTRKDLMLIKIACKVKNLDLVVREAVDLLKNKLQKLKGELNTPEEGVDASKEIE